MASLAEIHAQNYSDMPFDDFARKYHEKFYADMPFDAFAQKVGIASQPKEQAPQVDTMTDVAKSVAGGLGRGATSLLGLPGDLLRFGSRVGIFPDSEPPIPSSKQIQDKAEGVTGKFYEPKTTAGKYASTVSEFMPGALLGPGSLASKALMGTTAALGSETAGQMTEGTSAEPYARLIGGLTGAFAPSIAARGISPMRIAPERQQFLDTLDQAGVPLTAGQRTGSKGLQWMESHLGDLPGSGGVGTAMRGKQLAGFTGAALNEAGVSAERALPDTVKKGFKDIGDRIDTVTGRNVMQMDAPFAQEFGDAVRTYVNNVNPAARAPAVGSWVDDVVNIANQGGVLDGRAYQQMRSRLTKMAENTGDADLKFFYGNLRRSLDSAMERSIQAANPADAGLLAEARRQWGNLKDISKASAAAGENAAQGFITPQQMRAQVASGNNRQRYAKGQGDLAELTRAGNAIIPQLANSGTPARLAAEKVLSAPAAVVGGFAGGLPGALAGAVAPFAPGLAGRGLMSPVIQRYLANQAAAGVNAPSMGRLGLLMLSDPRARGLLAAQSN